MNFYGQISLTKLCDFARNHPEMVKEVTFRDGHVEKMIDIDVNERREPSKFGNVAYIRCRSANGDKAYVADLKRSKFDETNQQQQTATMPEPADIEYAKIATNSAKIQQLEETLNAKAIGAGKIDELPF